MSDPAAFPGYSAAQRAASPELYSWQSVADFSSVGPLADGRRGPLLMAPGVSVMVAYAFAGATGEHDDYVYEAGTSFSAPAVAGAALLVDELVAGRRQRS